MYALFHFEITKNQLCAAFCQAYQGLHAVYAPYKKPPHGALNGRQRAYNVVHSWYRVTVEHCIAYLKRYVWRLFLRVGCDMIFALDSTFWPVAIAVSCPFRLVPF